MTKRAFTFPGQGSQRPGMLGELFVAFPRLQRHLAGAPDIAALMFPPEAWTQERREEQRLALTDTRAAQPALGLAGLAVADLLRSLGVEPELVGGHSYGELVALTVAGAIREQDLAELSAARAECILAAAGEDAGAMAAAGAPRAAVEPHLVGVVVANENAPDQTVSPLGCR